MVKGDDKKKLPVVQQSHGSYGVSSSSSSRTFFCHRFSTSFCGDHFNLKCAVVLIFSAAVFLSAVFWLLPLRHKQAGFDVKDSIKLSASVQAYFKLQKPVSELVHDIARLEYDINEEIGVPSSKVAVLSMHPAYFSNETGVVFGFLSDPINSTISSVSLSVLKPSLVDLFLQQCNLTLTSSIFGKSSSFEILRFPGGITMIPERAAFVSQIPQVLFSFIAYTTIHDVKENLLYMKHQLNLTLDLRRDEVLYIQVTNKYGSTTDPPVTIEASVLGTLHPERLKELAQIITRSPPTDNLGLDHTVFGKVKEISLSSFLSHSLYAPAPTPSLSPAPSPEQNYNYGPSEAPSYPPPCPPCSNCYTSAPSGVGQRSERRSRKMHSHSLSPSSNSPAQSVAHGSPHCGSIDPPSPPPTYPKQMFPNVSPNSSPESSPADSSTQVTPSPPLRAVAYVSRVSGKKSRKYLLSPPQVSPSS